jgi:hypothetical protein
MGLQNFNRIYESTLSHTQTGITVSYAKKTIKSFPVLEQFQDFFPRVMSLSEQQQQKQQKSTQVASLSITHSQANTYCTYTFIADSAHYA